MNANIIIGGVIPAIVFGVAMSLIKVASLNGLSSGTTIILTGLGVLTIGIVGSIILKENFAISTVKGGFSAFFVGIAWGCGALLMAVATSKLNLPMAISASLAAVNIVIATLISLTLLGEAGSFNIPKLIIGIILVIIGSVVISFSS